MIYQYKTQGTCSRAIAVDVDEDGVINEIYFEGGCNGNLQGVSALAKGRKAGDIIHLLEGIPCADKPTSCPDQLARALKLILEKIDEKE